MLHINVAGGTGAGRRPPMQEGHGPRCICRRCLPYPEGHVEYVPPKKEK